ncbi:cyanophycinase [Paenibacillus sp. MAH-36]|uniref:Type 1 glutamine amidotransferase-like domain-containing protein n=1 Tax=Paenibacillus violae TaxID=3077234 RepID=A0ABU3RKM6_9BACL|nr:Type 1 glutamine amidotransferase-like domain-containing protein [Paenibacillus sp. PFR10]MDU0204859.1 Type 1 glutamine amidotransferase-like domain-containing protein [Paenibacillus sp. PFR10]
MDDNKAVWGTLYDAAVGGGLSSMGVEQQVKPNRKPRIAVLCSAAPSLQAAKLAYHVDDCGFSGYGKLFQKYGFEPLFIPIAIDNYQRAAYDDVYIELIANVQAVWLNGGDQAKHARCLLTDEGEDTPLLRAVREVYHRGGVVAGSSAGASVQGTWTYGEGTLSGYRAGLGLVHKSIASATLVVEGQPDVGGCMKGFGFASELNACVDTHFRERSREVRLPLAVRSLNSRFGIGVDENTAILIRAGLGSVVGENQVRILVNEQASRLGLGYSLRAGDTFDFNLCVARDPQGGLLVPSS